MIRIAIIAAIVFFVAACDSKNTSTSRESQNVLEQQSQYTTGQPVPRFDWSLERDLLIQLYKIRNQRVSTHSVWRSNYGTIEGDCSSVGYGLPYDTSLTNPVMATRTAPESNFRPDALTTIEQAEPNGIYASKNTNATWVMCVGEGGGINPVYVESRVTSYPFPVNVDYANNRVTRAGESSVNIDVRQ